MKTFFFIALKVIVLTVILFVCFAVAGGIIAQPDSSQMHEQPDSEQWLWWQ